MHTSQRIPLHISILVFTSVMTWLGVFVDIDSQMILFQICYKMMAFYNQEIIKCLSSVRPFVMFLHKLNISFICKDIFTKFAGNVYGYENQPVHNFGLILENKMAAIANCFEKS